MLRTSDVKNLRLLGRPTGPVRVKNLSLASHRLADHTQLTIRSIFSRPRRRTAFRGPAITHKNKTRDVSVRASHSYTFADLQPKDIHGVTHTQSALSYPLRTRARAVPPILTDVVLSSPAIQPEHEHMLGSRRHLRSEEPSLSPRAAPRCARCAR